MTYRYAFKAKANKDDGTEIITSYEVIGQYGLEPDKLFIITKESDSKIVPLKAVIQASEEADLRQELKKSCGELIEFAPY